MINPLLGLPFRSLLKFLTVGFLAPVFRDALGVQWSDGKQRHFERLFLLVAFVNRFPARIHSAGRQLSAVGRCAQTRSCPQGLGLNNVDVATPDAEHHGQRGVDDRGRDVAGDSLHLIGLAWTFSHPGQVQQRQEQLQTRLPAGSDLVAFGEITSCGPCYCSPLTSVRTSMGSNPPRGRSTTAGGRPARPAPPAGPGPV